MASSQSNRDMNIINATDLPSPRRFWTVIVQVLRKDDVKVGKTGNNFQGYVLTDMQGTFFSAVAFEPNIAMFNRLLHPYKRYYLSNALLKQANPDFQISDYSHSWTLSAHTHVELLEDSVPYTIPCNFDFTRFTELHSKIERDEPIAVRCLIVHSIPIGVIGKGADYVVIDEEGIPMMVRVWGDLVDNGQNHVTARLPTPTMAVFLNVRVTTHHGLSMSTKNTSSMFHNPPIATAASLLEWYDKHTQLVSDLLRVEAYRNADVLLPAPSPDMIMSVSDVLGSIDQIRAAWVKGTLQLLPAQEKLWYTCCRNCNRSVSSYITWEFTCTSCGIKAPVQQRCHVGFYLTDDTDTMCVTVFSPDVEKLIGYTADQLKESDEKNVSLTKEIEATVYKKPATCFVKYYDKSFRGSSLRTYPVQKLYIHHVAPEDAIDTAAAAGVHAGGSSIPGAAIDAAAADQLFSPTTRRVLDEIHADSSADHASSAASNSVKRSLFHVHEPEPSTEHASMTVDAAVATPAVFAGVSCPFQTAFDSDTITTASGKKGVKSEATSGIESPVKRMKNKEKEC